MYLNWNRKPQKQNGVINNIVERNSYVNKDNNIPDDYKAFDKENRTFYNLERIWRDGKQIDLEQF